VARYGQAFKNRVVARLLPPESAPLAALAQEVGVSADTLAVHVKQLVASSSSHGLRNAARQGSVLHLRSFRVEGDGFDV